MATRVYILAITFLVKSCTSQEAFYIDDIPIENYNHGDHLENGMDLELLPVRHGRSSDDDPKDYFFRSMRSFDDSDDVRSFGPFQNIPRIFIQSEKSDTQHRRKRDAPNSTDEVSQKNKLLSGLVDNLGQTLEVIALDTRNLVEKEDKAENRMANDGTVADKAVLINDFIRFRRSPNQGNQPEFKNEENDKKNNHLTQNLMMEPSNDDMNRETRGLTKDQWISQQYPVQKLDEVTFDDNLPSSSENVRAPRVHFVTQSFNDNRFASSEARPYEREPRFRNLDRDPPPRELAREIIRDNLRENPAYDRKFRSYAWPPNRDRTYYRDEQNLRFDPRDHPRDYYGPRYENYERTRNDYNYPIQKPQKRIIYYATLPEISRSPPKVDLRDRYRYDRDRFDDRYTNDQYRFRKSYPKSRYEDEGKTPYPIKVLTDVNVKEVKKNPERRIYSEVDRTRYAYNMPRYRTAER